MTALVAVSLFGATASGSTFELLQPELFGVTGGQPNAWADFDNNVETRAAAWGDFEGV